MQIKLSFQGSLREFGQKVHLEIARGARVAAERFAARAKLAYRGVVRPVLGDRVANTVRVEIYPKSASVRTHKPAVLVYSKAPKILYAHSAGVTIASHEGIFLAIPTENVPPRRGRHATPGEVRAIYGVDQFTLVPGKGGTLLGFVPAMHARSGRGFRRASSIRTGRQSRQAKLVLMFIFVRQITLRPQLNWTGVTDNLAQVWLELFGSEIANALKQG
jgi:hypothetical protein